MVTLRNKKSNNPQLPIFQNNEQTKDFWRKIGKELIDLHTLINPPKDKDP